MKRVVLIVLDSVGIGALPDATTYGDVGANTLGSVARKSSNFSLPNMQKLGLGNIEDIDYIESEKEPMGSFGRLAEKSSGKDTTTGHWEIAGVKLDNPFPVYENGFPEEIIKEFEERIGTKTLGNFAASGTKIIEELGSEHENTGYPIVYTSADSVFQIAAHENVISIDRLYEMCQIARELLTGEHGVGRVIARPFEGKKGNYRRTSRRKDFSIKPTQKTMLDIIKEENFFVKAVGKIDDIFASQGITHSVHTHGNMEGVDKTVEYMKEDFEGLIFTNLVDFDMLFGHRNDVDGYAKALMDFDNRLPELLASLKRDDVLIITADHGCDPAFEGTDHTREYVPLLVYGDQIKAGINLKTGETFGDIATTILDILGIRKTVVGTSFFSKINKSVCVQDEDPH